MSPTPQQLVRAHQFLYYVLNRSVWSDYVYDKFCDTHGIQGGGGSDLASSYTDAEAGLAWELLENPAVESVSRK